MAAIRARRRRDGAAAAAGRPHHCSCVRHPRPSLPRSSSARPADHMAVQVNVTFCDMSCSWLTRADPLVRGGCGVLRTLDDLIERGDGAAAPLRRYRTAGLVRRWSLAMQRRSAPLGRLQLGIVALALAGTMRCPVMPPGTMRRITAMSRHRDHLPGLASSLHFYGMREAPAIPLRDRGRWLGPGWHTTRTCRTSPR